MAAAYYVDITPEDFGSKGSPYLAVDPPIAIDFEPKPGEIVNGLFIAKAGKPYPYAKPGKDFTAHYFELFYDPETKLFVGGRMHFTYTEYEKVGGYPIIYGFYDVYAEILPASGQPPWIIIGQQPPVTRTITSPSNTSPKQETFLTTIVTKTITSIETVTIGEEKTPVTPLLIVIIVAEFVAAILLARRGQPSKRVR